MKLAGDFTNIIRGCARPTGVVIIICAAVQMAVEGITPPGWFYPFLVFAGEWFVERPIKAAKEKKSVNNNMEVK